MRSKVTIVAGLSWWSPDEPLTKTFSTLPGIHSVFMSCLIHFPISAQVCSMEDIQTYCQLCPWARQRLKLYFLVLLWLPGSWSQHSLQLPYCFSWSQSLFWLRIVCPLHPLNVNMTIDHYCLGALSPIVSDAHYIPGNPSPHLFYGFPRKLGNSNCMHLLNWPLNLCNVIYLNLLKWYGKTIKWL